jgi:hypothetical protein
MDGKLLNKETRDEITLIMKQYCISVLQDAGIADNHLRVQMEYRIQYMAEQLVVDLCVLGQDICKDREIARYPANLWQHIKFFLGLKCREVVILQSEAVIWPGIKIPEIKGEKHRIKVDERQYTTDPGRKDDEYPI